MHLKTDSFVVESNVHFPTDYNLLWDCLRKSLDIVGYFTKHHKVEGWRKYFDWFYRLKRLMRSLGRASSGGGKNKEKRQQEAAQSYLSVSLLLLEKTKKSKLEFPVNNEKDLISMYFLEEFMALAYKHIDLIERRILKGEKIPHEEKIFSIFETYTEWITKGKLRPNVELGKRVAITTDQYNLIVDYQIMEHEEDRDIVIAIADRLLPKYSIYSWSFDKGFWSSLNRDLLRLVIPNVVMPKIGKLTKEDKELETSRLFKKLKNKHSAIESNINELEHRGLDRCPDRGYFHFKSYVALAVCAYNLKKIGKQILANQRNELDSQQKVLHKKAA